MPAPPRTGTSSGLPEIFIALPALLALIFVALFGVNVPYWDDFNLIPLLDKFVHGSLTFADLWAQHNENRVLFPNLGWIAATALFNDDLKIVMLIDVVLMIGSGALFYAVWRRAGASRWLAVPASFLYFTLLQHEDLLEAFQLSWYLISFAFAMIVFIFDREERPWYAVAAAFAAAVVASFSSLQGLFCWPAAAVYLIAPKDRRLLVAWLAAGLGAAVVYFWGFDFHNTGDVPLGNSFVHLLQAVPFAVVALGGLFTGNSPENLEAIQIAGILGLVVVATAAFAVWLALRTRLPWRLLRLPAALLVFATLFVVAIAVGRSSDASFNGAVASRYTLFTAYVPIATLYLLDAAFRERRSQRAAYGLAATGTMIAIAILASLVIGPSVGSYTLGERQRDVVRLQSAATEPDDELAHLWCCPSLIRSYAAMARADHLMSFEDDAPAR